MFAQSGFSFDTWFRTSSSGPILGQFGNNSGFVPAIYIGTDGRLNVSMFWSGAASGASSIGAVNDGQWHHLAVSRTSTAQRVYLDGALQKWEN